MAEEYIASSGIVSTHTQTHPYIIGVVLTRFKFSRSLNSYRVRAIKVG